ncbi:Retroviral nucleocapsid protein Gag containing protein [Cricetulus griseus]|nr:Retroviral nucleocapsid protein Gag containing protein [Cricetulus griseus]
MTPLVNMDEFLSSFPIGNLFNSYVNSMFEEEVDLLNIGLYALLAVNVLIYILSLARSLRNRDKDNFTTCLQDMQALRNEVLETRLTHDMFMQHVEQKLDDMFCSMFYTIWAELSTTQAEMQRIYNKINAERCSISEALEARQSENHDELKNICNQLETQIASLSYSLVTKIQDTQDRFKQLDQLETQIASLSYSLDTKVQDTQDRFQQLDNAINSGAKKCKGVDDRVESKFQSLQDELQTRVDKLERSINLIAEANHDLKAKLQFLDSSFHATQMLARDESIKHLEKRIEEQSQKFTDLLSCLESFMIKEIETFREVIITKLKDRWEDSETESLQSEAPTPPRYLDHSKVVTCTPLFYPPTMIEKPSTKKHPQGQVAYVWQPIQLKDLTRIKESVVSYGLHSPYVKKLLHSWATFNTVTPTDWVTLVSAVLENSCQIQWKSLIREEGKLLEGQTIKDGYDTPLEKILGKDIYADPQVQAEYDDHILSLCKKAALNTWDKAREPGEQLEAYTKIEQGPIELFQDFLDRLTRAVELQVTDLAIRHSIVYTIAYDNANPYAK